MRPLKLQIRGFTAFRDPTEIDFTPFDVFAVSGPTGSGKSSLLDAMTYALYGRVERVGDRVGQLVSQGQPRMAVTLEFEVGHDRYRVTRSTPSSKGATKILLERLIDGEWRQAGDGADRVREAEPMITRAIGLTYDGFTRSVLLPQGKFAEFLVGDARKRRDILTELLGLSLFRRMAERAGAIGKEAAVRADTMTGLLEREYAGATPEALKEAKAAAREAAKREKALGIAAEVALEVLGRWHDSQRSTEELGACAAEATRAAEQAAEAAEELAELGSRLAAAREQVAELGAGLETTQAALDAAQAALREAEATLGSVDALTEAQTTARLLADAASNRKAREKQRAELQARAAALTSAIHAAEANVSAREKAVGAAESKVSVAQEALEKVRHANLVAAVSAGLKAGDPCPVCGLPLETAPNTAAPAALGKAETSLAAVQDRLATARTAMAKAQGDLEATRRELAANAEHEARLAAEVADMDEGMAEALTVLRSILGDPVPDDPVAEVDRRLAEWQRLDRVERDATREVASAERLLMRAEHDRDQIVGLVERRRERGGGPTARVRGGGVGGGGAGGRGAPPRGFAGAARPAAGRLDLPSLPPPPGPEDLDGLGAFAEDLTRGLRAFAAELTDLVTDLASVEGRLLAEAAAKVGDLVGPARSLDELGAAVTAAYRSATSELATTAKAAEDLKERLERKKELDHEVAELVARSRLFKALSLELRADRLIAFLQAEALQVLATAGSDRLSGLSDGRYRLVCRDDEFLVVDTWNGDEERSVRTLSGGETFLASLALALALADQVRSLSITDRARLDSLFLDEGFGTLDAETLRIVVDAIEQLAGDGRLVGVITHVGELAEQFPRIEVRKDRVGSKLEVVA